MPTDRRPAGRRPPPRPGCSSPPARVPKTGAPGARGAAAWAARTAPTRVCSDPGRPGQRRHRGDQRQIVGAAGVDPAEHRVDQPVAPPGRRTGPGPAPRPRRPASGAEQRPAAVAVGVRASAVATVATAARSPGTPTSVPPGIGRSPPSTTSAACPTVGCTIRPARPSRRASATAADSPPAGSRIRNDSAPNSTGRPASSPVRSLPPSAPDCSYTVISVPAGARSRSRTAAARPGDPAADHRHPPRPRPHGSALLGPARGQLVHQRDHPGQHLGVGLRQHAVTEVEHVPGGGPALRERSAAPRPRSPATARTARSGRGCPAPPGPGRSGRSPRPAGYASPPRPRPRRPRPSRRAARRCPPRSGSAAPRRRPARSARRSSAAARTGGSRPRTARRPTSRTAAPRRRRRRPAPAGTASVTSASRRAERVPQLRLAVHQRLGLGVGPRRPALDQVAGQRERRAGEADQRGVAQLGDEQPDRLVDVGDVVAGRSGGSAPRRRRCGSARRPPGRCRARCPGRRRPRRPGTTMSLNRIAASTPCRRTGCRVISVTRSGRRQESSIGTLGPDLPVLRQRPAGLAHEPDRGVRARARVGRPGRRASRPVRCGGILRLGRQCPWCRWSSPPSCHAPGRDRRAGRCDDTARFRTSAGDARHGRARRAVERATARRHRLPDMAPPIALPETFARAVAGLRSVDPPAGDRPGGGRRAPAARAVRVRALARPCCATATRWPTGRLILLHDPAGHEAWQGTLRLVTYVTAELEVDLAADPLLPGVGWTWLTDALDAHEAAPPGDRRHGHPDHVDPVRRPGRPAAVGDIEIRASWTPLDDDLGRPPARPGARCSPPPPACPRPASPPCPSAARRRGLTREGGGTGSQVVLRLVADLVETLHRRVVRGLVAGRRRSQRGRQLVQAARR